MDIIKARSDLIELKSQLDQLVSNDVYSRKEESEIRDKIKALSRPLAIEETKLIIAELDIKFQRGKITQEEHKRRKDNNLKKLEILQ